MKKNVVVVVVVVVVVGLLASAGVFAVVKHWEDNMRLQEFKLRAYAHSGAVLGKLESVRAQVEDAALVVEYDINEEGASADKPEELLNAIKPILMPEKGIIDVSWGKVDASSKQITTLYSVKRDQQYEDKTLSVSNAFAGDVHLKDNTYEIRLMMPVYYTDEAGKHTSMAGMLVTDWNLQALIESGLAHTPPSAQDISYSTQTADGTLERVYYHPSRTRTEKDKGVHTGIVNNDEIDYAGMHWKLMYEAAPKFMRDYPLVRAWQSLLLCLLLTCFAAWAVYRNKRYTEKVEWEVQVKTAELKKSEAEFRNIIEDLQDIYCKLDLDGNISYVSPSVKQLGYTPYEVLCSNFRKYCVEKHAYKDLIEELYEKGRVENFHIQLRHKHNDVHWFLVHMQLRKDEHGKVVSIDGTLRDYTEVKESNERIHHMDRLESLGVLAGGIAHDFNNLLTSILGNASIARMKIADESPVVPLLDTIEKSSCSAAELCKQMLAYAGKGKYTVSEIDLGATVGTISNLLKSAVGSKVELQYKCAESIPPMEGDVGQVQQVIMNLITNAAESYDDKPGVVSIVVGAKTVDQDILRSCFEGEKLPEGVYVCVQVSDHGCGMDVDTINRIFEPFYTTKFTGRGLGMSAVRGILRSHFACLRVRSKVGKGTTMTVFFPVVKRHQQAAVSESSAIPELAPHKHSGTVLVVDDEDIVREAAVEMLEGLGYQVLTAEDGKQGVEIFKQHMDEIELVLLDMTMPVMDGKQCFKRLKALKDDVKVVLSSGYGEDTALQDFSDDLAGFLQKPYLMSDLDEVIAKAFQKNCG